DNGILDEPPASLRNLLFDLFAIEKILMVSEGDGLRKLVGALAFVELLFNRLAEFHLINETQDKVGFRDFAKLFERLIQRVVFRVGIQPSKELGGGCLLQLNGGNEAQHLVPLGVDEGGVDIPIGQQIIALLCVLMPLAEAVELLMLEGLDPWGEGE